MEVHTRHTPAFGVARVVLAGGEAVRAEQGALLASSFGVMIGRQARTSARAGAKDPLAVFTAPEDGGWVDLASRSAGDVYPLQLDESGGWCVAKGAVLAQPTSVRRDATWPGFHPLFGSEHGFLDHYTGHGPLVLACPGPVDAFELGTGELLSMNPSYLLAYPGAIQCRLRAIDPAGPQSMRTGQGLLLDFAGPGTVLSSARVFQRE